MPYRVTLIPGDGIGPEVTAAARRVLEATGVQFDWDVRQLRGAAEEAAVPAPGAAPDSAQRTRVVLEGPSCTPVVFGPGVAVFKPAQSSAPEYAGMNKANPLAMIRSGALMLRHLGENDAADRLERAVAAVIAEGKMVPYDMKADRNDVTAVGTSQVADGIVAKLLAR